MNQPNRELDPRLNEKIEMLRAVPPRDPQAAARGRVQFLAQAKEIEQAVSRSEKQRHIGWFGSIQNGFTKKEYKPMFTTLFSILTVLVLAFGGSVATAYAAQDDLPGDTLYSVKLFTEDTRLTLADDSQDIALYEEFAQRRVQEAVQLSDGSRFEDVASAMLRYEAQLQEMNQTLVRLASKDPAQADALAARMQAMLATQVQTLTQLRQRAADPARGPIDGALTRSREHAGIEFAGLVEAISPDTWVIAERIVAVTAQTEIKGSVVVGSLVKVHAYLAPDDTLTAREIELVVADTALEITGFVETMTDSSWMINGQTIIVTDGTEIRDDVQVGDWVVAKVLLSADGSLTALLIHLPGGDGIPGNGNEDNGNGSDDNGNDDNGNDDNGNDDNGNDDNGNGSDDNSNDDNGNGSDDNGNDDNGNGSDDNGNDDNGNGSDDNGNDDNGNGSDDNGNDDNGNGSDDNGNDDNGNGSDDNGNDDNGNGSDSNGNDDNGNGSDDNGNDDNGNGSDDNGNDDGSDDNGNDNENDDDNGNGNGSLYWLNNPMI